MHYGKIIGGLIGLAAANLFGLLVGLFLGHLFDRGLAKTLRFASPENVARLKQSFFKTTFLLSGYLAKSDGRISQHEIDHTEAVIAQMSLGPEQRAQAIAYFREGAADSFQLQPVIAEFLAACGPQRQVRQALLMFLVSLALADQKMEKAEYLALQRIASLLGFTPMELEKLLRMARAQGSFHGRAGPGAQPGTSLEDAYAALGVSKDADDKTIKRAYRKLMSQNHPDKLIAKGVPEDMIKLATERSQDILSAYEMVKKSRA